MKVCKEFSTIAGYNVFMNGLHKQTGKDCCVGLVTNGTVIGTDCASLNKQATIEAAFQAALEDMGL